MYQKIGIAIICFSLLYVFASIALAQIPQAPQALGEFVTPPDCNVSPKPNGCTCIGSNECTPPSTCQSGICTAPASGGPPPNGTGITNPIQAQTFGQLVEAIARAITAIGIPLVAIFLVWSGFLFVTARGNEQQLERAKTTFKTFPRKSSERKKKHKHKTH